jgi:myo-inositol-1(or 4)-monophosphatase
VNLDKEITARKQIAVKAVKEAGQILCANFGKVLKIKSKGDRDLVSNIDLKSEKTIISLIKKYFPGDDILSEENKYQLSGSDFKWVIDPIDGTHNYIRGIEVFGISIALAFNDEVVIGVIYMPMLDEMYMAQRGQGTYLNNKKIHVSKKRLKESTIIFDSTIRYDKKPMLVSLGRLADKVFNIRMFGSTVRSLTYVAEGKAEVEIEYCDKVWDFAAGLLLVEEAGGTATDFKGRKWNLKTVGYVASNRVIHKDILKMLKHK